MRRQALSLLVENNPGVTSRISGLFSRRGFNIDSFSSGATADPRYTRITIVASGDEQVLEQIEKQLAKLEDVLDIKKLEPGLSVCRELIMIKIRALDTQRQAVILMYLISGGLCLSAVLFTEIDGFYAIVLLIIIVAAIFIGAKKIGILNDH